MNSIKPSKSGELTKYSQVENSHTEHSINGIFHYDAYVATKLLPFSSKKQGLIIHTTRKHILSAKNKG